MNSREFVELIAAVSASEVLLIGALHAFVTPSAGRWVWHRQERKSPILRVFRALGWWLASWLLGLFGLIPVLLALASAGAPDLMAVPLWLLSPAVGIVAWQCWIGRYVRRAGRLLGASADISGHVSNVSHWFELSYRVARRRARLVTACLVLLPACAGLSGWLAFGAASGRDWLIPVLLLSSALPAAVLWLVWEVVNRMDPLAAFVAVVIAPPSAAGAGKSFLDRLLLAPWERPSHPTSERHRLLRVVPAAALALRHAGVAQPRAAAVIARLSADELTRRFAQSLASGTSYSSDWREVRTRILDGECGPATLPADWTAPGVWSPSDLLDGPVARAAVLMAAIAAFVTTVNTITGSVWW